MPSSYSPNIGLEIMATGDQPGQWGNTTNNNLVLVDQACNAVAEIGMASGRLLLSKTNGDVSGDTRKKVLHFTGNLAGAPATIQFQPNEMQAWYHVINDSGAALQFQQGSGPVYVLENGYSNIVACDGAFGSPILAANASIITVLEGLQLTRLLIKKQPTSGADDPSFIVQAPMSLTGSLTLNGPLALTGNTTLTGTLAVTDDAVFQKTVTVAGTTTLNGPLVGNNSITLNGALSVSSGLVSGTFGVAGKFAAIGGVHFDFSGDSTGDMYYRGAAPAGDVTRLPPGAAGQYLRQYNDGTTVRPQWASPTIDMGTPIGNGGVSGSVLYNWGNALAQSSNLFFNGSFLGVGTSNPQQKVHVYGTSADNAVFIAVDAAVTGSTNVLHGFSMMTNGKARWEFITAFPEPGAGSNQGSDMHCIGHHDDDSYYRWMFVKRSNGHVVFGNNGDDYGGMVNIGTAVASDIPLVIRGNVAEVPNVPNIMLSFRDPNNVQVAAVTQTGVFLGKMAAQTVTLTAQFDLGSGVGGLPYPDRAQTGIFGFVKPSDPATQDGILAFRYCNTAGAYGTVYLNLPKYTSGALSNLTWRFAPGVMLTTAWEK